jgi:hypothetical protein
VRHRRRDSLRAGERHAEPVGPSLLERCGFTDHVIERFAARAGLRTTNRQIIEPLIRELLLREGTVVSQRPRWSRSRNRADLYLQLGQWMLFIGCKDRRRSDRYSVVTVVNGEENTTWKRARRLGYIRTPPPPTIAGSRPEHINALGSVLIALRDREPRHRGLLATIRRIHRTRTATAQTEYEQAILDTIRSDPEPRDHPRPVKPDVKV